VLVLAAESDCALAEEAKIEIVIVRIVRMSSSVRPIRVRCVLDIDIARTTGGSET
jgi:hypothetical protein